MKLWEVEKLVDKLFDKHNINNDWSFGWDSAKRRFGQCNYRKRKISMSKVLTELNEEPVVKDTLLHEIAHALCGTGHHHDNHWKRVAKEIGANPKYCYDEATTITTKPKWIGTCPNGHAHHRHRKSSGKSSCYTCCPKYNKDFLVIWKHT